MESCSVCAYHVYLDTYILAHIWTSSGYFIEKKGRLLGIDAVHHEENPYYNSWSYDVVQPGSIESWSIQFPGPFNENDHIHIGFGLVFVNDAWSNDYDLNSNIKHIFTLERIKLFLD